ncbi:unnamed protein product [Diabrotica balteata]|uniref:TGF-beta family profile domain-containing protein n=1 Tax=Diabrotica balteata TaxID=107213 RepID=A0A9N9SUI6_DIABA|nr:unnamed protein product [Diabrotica balteata]
MEAFKPFLSFAKTTANVSDVRVPEYTELTNVESFENEIGRAQSSSSQDTQSNNSGTSNNDIIQVQPSAVTPRSSGGPKVTFERKTPIATKENRKRHSQPSTSVKEIITYFKGKKVSFDAIDQLFLAHACTLKTFSPRRQIETKMKIAQVIMEQELLQLGECPTNQSRSASADTYPNVSSLKTDFTEINEKNGFINLTNKEEYVSYQSAKLQGPSSASTTKADYVSFQSSSLQSLSSASTNKDDYVSYQSASLQGPSSASTNKEDYTPFVEISTVEAKHRVRRNIGLNCDDESNETICCRYPLMVDFEAIGLDFIIAPKRYDAYMCSGECPYVTLQSQEKERFRKASTTPYLAAEKILLDHILFLHAMSGSDTTSALFNQGKLKFLKVLQKNKDLQSLIESFKYPNLSQDEIATAGNRFLTALYGKKETKLNDLRYKQYVSSSFKNKTNISSLPPSEAAARKHSLRVYYQVQQWLSGQATPN